MRRAPARGSVALFFVVLALPVALLGLSLASEWSALLILRRQAESVAELAATAAAAAADPSDPTTIDPTLAQEAAEAMLARAISPTPVPGGSVRMLPPARGSDPTIAVQLSPDRTVATATLAFQFPQYPVLDLLSVAFGGSRQELSSSATASAGICFTGVEEGSSTSAGCRFLQVG